VSFLVRGRKREKKEEEEEEEVSCFGQPRMA